jgi:hypothetical protein
MHLARYWEARCLGTFRLVLCLEEGRLEIYERLPAHSLDLAPLLGVHYPERRHLAVPEVAPTSQVLDSSPLARPVASGQSRAPMLHPPARRPAQQTNICLGFSAVLQLHAARSGPFQRVWSHLAGGNGRAYREAIMRSPALAALGRLARHTLPGWVGTTTGSAVSGARHRAVRGADMWRRKARLGISRTMFSGRPTGEGYTHFKRGPGGNHDSPWSRYQATCPSAPVLAFALALRGR